MSSATKSTAIPSPEPRPMRVQSLRDSPVSSSPSEESAVHNEAVDSDEVVLKHAKDRLQVYRSLMDRTVDLFGNEIKASMWLSTPSPDFDGKPPIQVAQEVEFSADAIENLFEPVFVRIEEGIYW